MSYGNFRQILAVLDHGEDSMWAVLERAVELADAQRARLTLAKTTDPGWIVKWFGPLAMLSRVACVADLDLQTFARNQLARASEFVPASIPLTTLLLGTDTPCALRRLVAGNPYDLLVIGSSLPAHSRRLRREITGLQLCALTVSPRARSKANLLERSAADPSIH